MRILTQLSPDCLDDLESASSAASRGLLKWIAEDCLLCNPSQSERSRWKDFLNSLPKDVQDPFTHVVRSYAVNISEENFLSCGHWRGVDLILTTEVGATERLCSCGAELTNWMTWADSLALERLRALRSRPMLRGRSRDREMGDRLDIFLRFCTTLTIIDRYLTNAVYDHHERQERIPGVSFFNSHESSSLRRVEILCANHGRSRVNSLLQAIPSEAFFDNFETLVWCGAKEDFQKVAHHRLLGFTIKGRTHTISLDKGLISLADDPLTSDIPSQYMAPDNGAPRTKEALNFIQEDAIHFSPKASRP